jgi:hypothetical protein
VGVAGARLQNLQPAASGCAYTRLVRGDSLRDLYAKTLALLGLGVLAGAGALVDYLPVGVRLPDANPALTLPPIARALPVRAVRIPSEIGLRAAARQTVPEPASVARFDQTVTPLPIAQTASLEVGRPVRLYAPVYRSIAVASFSEPSSDELAGVAGDDGLIESQWLPERIAFDATQAPDDGFFTAAVKKTGSSIVRTGARTGASIVDGLRAVGGAVRWALPLPN